jgi:hypothetical protein
MDRERARRLTAAWSREITDASWPWPDVEPSRAAIDSARDAMHRQLIEYIPEDVEIAAAAWQDDGPAVLALAGDAVFVARCSLEPVAGQVAPVARGELRRVALDARTAALSVTSTYRIDGRWDSRTSRWRFDLDAGTVVELTAELAEEAELSPEEELARAIAGRLGWSVPRDSPLGA